MYNLLNKILSRFHLKLVSTKPDTRLVKESVKFLNTLSPEDLSNDKFFPPYVGDVVYFQKQVKGEFPQVSGKTYLRKVWEENTNTLIMMVILYNRTTSGETK
jgi:hypothetical protein